MRLSFNVDINSSDEGVTSAGVAVMAEITKSFRVTI
jgi:hypothetical protein